MPSRLKPFVEDLLAGRSLSEDQAGEAFNLIMEGQVPEALIAAFLTALRMKGESPIEMAGAVEALRARMVHVQAPAGAIDVVGTGGDGRNSHNISTAAALVVAACGVPVAKHGNRGVSSRCGAADLLSALGVNIELEPDDVRRSMDATGFGFMFAPRHHAAMRHVGPVRAALGFRTVFNMIGPLSNPARVERALIGVYARERLTFVAKTVRRLGLKEAWIVHSAGFDELTTTGPCDVVVVSGDRLETKSFTPEDLGLERAAPEALEGGNPEQNAQALRRVFAGESGAHADAVVLNAAAALVVSGAFASLEPALSRARSAITEGTAQRTLERLIATSNEGR